MIGIIVINSYTYSESVRFKVNRIIDEFKKNNISIDIYKTIDLKISIENFNCKMIDLNKYSFCIYLDKDIYVSKMLEQYIPLYNSSRSIELCDDKMLTYISLLNNNIRMPLTIAAPLCYKDNPDEKTIINFISYVESKLEFPLICKESFGSLGKQVRLISNHKELCDIYKSLIKTPHIYQRFIKSSCGIDYRIFTIDSKPVAWMQRKNDHDFRSNIALGGIGYNKKPPQSYLDMAEKASKILGLTYAGVDVLIDEDGEPTLAEVNSNAFFTEIEKISGVNISKLFVDSVLSKILK